jgi:hypothetical protein
MRTTLTLDDDVAAALTAEVRETGRTFKDVVNATLRAGLYPSPPSEPEQPVAHHLGLRPGIDIVRARHLADELEDDALVHKLDLRK